MASNTLKEIGDKLADFVDWVKDTLEDEEVRKSIAEDLGLKPGESAPKADLPQDKLDSISRYRSQANPDKEAFIILLNDVRAVYESVRGFISALGVSGVSAINQGVFEVFDLMALNYVRLYEPGLYFGLQLASVLVEDSQFLAEDKGEDTSAIDEIELYRFAKVLLNAINFLLSPFYYVFGSLKAGAEDEARARRVSESLFTLLAAEASLFTKEIVYGWDSLVVAKKEACNDSESKSPTPRADAISERMLTFAFPRQQEPSAGSETTESLRLSLALKPKSEGDQSTGMFISVGGEGSVEIKLTDRWKFVLEASANPTFSLLFDIENRDISGHGPEDAPLNIAVVSVPDDTDVTYAFPHRDETRVEIGQLSISFSFDGKQGGIKAQALRSALVLATKDQDGFLSNFLPADGLRIPFSFGVGFSTEKRFFTEGNVEWPTGHAGPRRAAPGAPRVLALSRGDGAGSPSSALVIARDAAPAGDGAQGIPNLSGTNHPELGLQLVIPIGKALLAVRLDHLTLALAPASDAAAAQAKTEVSVSMALKVGPVTAVVERIGFELGLSFPESGGNIGFGDLSMGFKAPSGAGIKVDSPFVSGGGFLFLDREKGQYAGFLQLNIQDRITVKAVGVITTRLPNGEKGFSFVVMITAEGFKPIPLGLGFTLTGIGGLLAINRTANEEFLREGIKNKTLDDLLFPKDPIRNATQIFGTLNNAFPPQEGSYLFGPVVQICWGTPPLLTMNLALLLELGNRTRLIILGRVSAILPTEKHDLIRLQMNAVGVVDFDQGSISLDAILFDSRLSGKFPITGSMAMRLNWGSGPVFALSIGGFHPAFKPPANFPRLERLAISFSNTDDFRLRAEIYLAITSNTIQFGAKVELFARAGSFSIEGQAGFDVLIQIDPFMFLADLYASVQLKYKSHNLFKVKIEGEMSGPRPLHVKGKASFEIFWCDFSVRFDKTLVKGDPPPQVEPVQVMAQLRAALDDSRNWSGQLPERSRQAVTLREQQAPDQIALHPLGRLAVRQNVVPLDLEISRFGNTVPSGARLFKINAISVNDKNVDFNRVNDFFAPSQFLELSDDEKLAAPSFEPMTAGITVGADDFAFTANDEDLIADDAITYETIIIDEAAEQPSAPATFALSGEALGRQLAFGAAARADLRRLVATRYRPAESKIRAVKKGWTVASREDGTDQPAPGLEAGSLASYAESFQALQQLKRQAPDRAKNLMLLRKTALPK